MERWFLIGVVSFCCLLSAGFSSPVVNKPVMETPFSPSNRALPRLITDCLLVGVEEATYFYKSTGSSDVCGLYLVGEPDQRVEITLEYLRVDCDSGGLVTFLDGWEMNGEVFPPMDENSVASRTSNFCGHVKKEHFTMSSNAATILYRTPKRGDSFSVTVHFVKHPKPCDVLLTSDAEIVTLRNYGRHRNCTLATVFPSSIKILQIAVGIDTLYTSSLRNQVTDTMTGVFTECQKRGFEDAVAVGGAPGLDMSLMQVESFFCGRVANAKTPWSHVLCDVSFVTLISSGRYHNLVTVAVTPITNPEAPPTTMCDTTM